MTKILLSLILPLAILSVQSVNAAEVLKLWTGKPPGKMSIIRAGTGSQ